MNRKVVSILVSGIFSGAVSSVAVAQDVSPFYVGAGYSVVALTNDEENFSDANNAGFQVGYRINENFAVEAQYTTSVKDAGYSMDISGDYTDIVKSSMMADGYSPAQVADINQVIVNGGASVDLSFDTLALYGVYRTSGALYAKFKAGVVSTELTPTASSNASMTIRTFSGVSQTNPIDGSAFQDGFASEASSEKETKFSTGIGVGYQFSSKFNAELEYTVLNEDVDAYSLNVNYNF